MRQCMGRPLRRRWKEPPVIDPGLLWIPATIGAAAAQTARNVMQRRLIDVIGTVGATQVRFLYGLPFACLFLVLVRMGTGEGVPEPSARFLVFAAGGALAQIAATALMLSAMRSKGFAVVTAFTKTEPVLVAVFALAVLGERLTLPMGLAILVATMGVVLVTTRKGLPLAQAGLGAAAMGIGSGALFAVAAVGFRGAILALEDGGFLIRATTTLVWGLGLQSLLLGLWMLAFDREALSASAAAWRGSLFAGLMGAVASQLWFIGFALTSAASVRTLGLVEVLFAALVSRIVFAQAISRREAAGLVLVTGGVALLLFAHP